MEKIKIKEDPLSEVGSFGICGRSMKTPSHRNHFDD
jgi:hypothetical protein